MKSQIRADFEDLIEKLEISSIKSQLFGELIQPDIKLDKKEVSKLLSYTSILSLSDESTDISQSYEIITRLLEVFKGENPYIITGAEIILSRIGNFPSKNLLNNRYFTEKQTEISPILKLESIVREAENTLFQEGNKEITLTDFQYKLFNALENENSLSVSAPTSAGKSFVLNLDLVRRIREREKQSIVYVVPTRALISEVSQRIRVTLRDEGLSEVMIRTAPFPVAKQNVEKAVVYVLTQERLMSLINTPDGEVFVTSLIVDEAHEIQKGKRGIVLQNAIDITLSKFPNASVLFASPLIKNPLYFLSLFNRNSSGQHFVETVSPVSQNIILVSQVNRKPKYLNIYLLTRNKVIDIGQININFEFRNNKTKQKANLALSVSTDGTSAIVFSNTPSDAEKVAEEISKINTFKVTQNIKVFIEFIKKDIHPEYPLINCLEYGVAFHYGRMPSLVRQGVEKLFKDGEIKLICCTSTLLQGVNLPAKHIIIENPKSGDTPMSRSDFLNLSGRAGRLLKEFHGNIWCIRPSDWTEECYKGEQLQEISSAISNLMTDGGVIVQDLLSSAIDESKKDEAEAAFGKLYSDYILNKSSLEGYRTDNNTDNLDKTIDSLSSIKVTIPKEILENNKALRPDHLQSVYDYLNNQQNFENLIPIKPHIKGSKKIMEDIFKIIVIKFEWNISDKYFRVISYLAYQWVWGKSIRIILNKTIEYNKTKKEEDQQSISTVIRNCLNVLENEIRFKLVKYFSAYIDILRVVLIEKELTELERKIEPYHVFLEFGSCKADSLNLMALGLSRFTALYLQGGFDLLETVEAEEYLQKMRKMNIDSFDMPLLCKQEVKDLIGN